MDELFSVSAKVSSMIDILSWKLERKNLEPIQVGIGLSYGRALMIKAGYKGSAVNEVVWMGDVVSEASKLCSYGNRGWSDKETMVSATFYDNLNEHNQSLLEWSSSNHCYHGYIINKEMNDWLEGQKSR